MTMIEKVKAAIEAVGGDDALDQMNPDYDKNLTALARAVIEAMKTPTDAMVNAAYTPAGATREPDGVWDVMISTALSER